MHQSPPTKAAGDLPIVELVLGFLLVLVSIKLSAGGQFSLARTAVLLIICGLIAAYGYFRNPYAPFYCYGFVSPLFPVFGSAIALIVAGGALVLIHRQRAQWRWKFSCIGVAFCLWSLYSLLWAERHYFGQDSFLGQMVPPMVLALMISGIQNPTFRRNLVLMVVVACAIGSAFAVRHYVLGIGAYGMGRTFALIRPDIFSAWEIFSFVGALVWLLTGNPPMWLRGCLLLCLVLIVVGIGLCGERAAIVAAGLGLLIVCICRKRVLQGLSVVIGILAVAVLFYALEPGMFDPVLDRFRTVQEDRGSERLAIWGAGLKVFADSPLIGVGLENFRFAVGAYYGEEYLSHSIYIGTLVELGIVGFILMACWFSFLMVGVWRSEERLWVAPLLAVYLLEGMFLHQFYFSCFWLTLGLAEGARASQLQLMRAFLPVRLAPASRRRPFQGNLMGAGTGIQPRHAVDPRH